MPSSPIRKLVPYADAAKARGTKIYHLNIGQPDIKTPVNALEAAYNFKPEVLSYIHSQGTPDYRNKLAKYYHGVNAKVTPDQIVVTTGGSEALLFGLLACLDDGDEVIIPEPFYANYNGFSQAGNIRVCPITARIENGFALPPMQDFEEKIGPKTKAILICNPNNPTGYFYSREELEALKTLVLKHDLFLFVDEVYREFVYDGKKHVSVLSLDGLEEHAIVIDSISKRYSACGARLGAMLTRNQEVLDTVLKFCQARLSPPTISEDIAKAALDTPASYFEEVIQEYIGRRDLLIEELNKIPGVNSPRPGGAFYTMAKLPVEDSDHFCQWILEEFEHKGASVMVAPGSGFYFTKGLGKQEVRIAYVLNKGDLKNAVEILREALAAYPNKTV